MFGLGMGEIVIIAIVALLFLGPERLPAAAKSIGRTIRGFKQQTRELTRSIEKDTQLGDAVREIRSALRDDPLPRQQTPGAPPADEGADQEEDPAASAMLSPEEEEALRAGDEAIRAEDEALWAEDESLRGGDPEMPVISPADDAVPRGEAEDDSSDAPSKSEHG